MIYYNEVVFETFYRKQAGDSVVFQLYFHSKSCFQDEFDQPDRTKPILQSLHNKGILVLWGHRGIFSDKLDGHMLASFNADPAADASIQVHAIYDVFSRICLLDRFHLAPCHASPAFLALGWIDASLVRHVEKVRGPREFFRVNEHAATTTAARAHFPQLVAIIPALQHQALLDLPFQQILRFLFGYPCTLATVEIFLRSFTNAQAMPTIIGFFARLVDEILASLANAINNDKERFIGKICQQRPDVIVASHGWLVQDRFVDVDLPGPFFFPVCRDGIEGTGMDDRPHLRRRAHAIAAPYARKAPIRSVLVEHPHLVRREGIYLVLVPADNDGIKAILAHAFLDLHVDGAVEIEFIKLLLELIQRELPLGNSCLLQALVNFFRRDTYPTESKQDPAIFFREEILQKLDLDARRRGIEWNRARVEMTSQLLVQVHSITA